MQQAKDQQTGSLLQHYSANEDAYTVRMFMAGLINNVGIGVLIAYTSTLASAQDQNYNFALFIVFLQTVSVLSIAFNAYFLIQIKHETRLMIACLLFIFSYLLLTVSITYQNLPFAALSCIIHQVAKSLGTTTIIGYIKAIPQEMIVTFCSGMGASSFFASFTTLVFIEFGLQSSGFFLALSLLIFPLYANFMWIEQKRLQFRQFQNYFVLSKQNPDISKREDSGAPVKNIELEQIEVIQDRNAFTFKHDVKSVGFTSGDSDHKAYNDESPLPSEERRYQKYLREKISDQKAQLRRSVNITDSEASLDNNSVLDNLDFKDWARKSLPQSVSKNDKIIVEASAAQQITPQKNGVKVFLNNQSLPPRKSQRLQNDIDAVDNIAKFQPSPEIDPKFEKNSLVSYWHDLNPKQNLSQSLAFGASDKASRFSRLFRHKTIIAQDLSQFRYEAKDNRRIQMVAVSRVFKKAGSFVFNLGAVNFLESVILNFQLLLYCYRQEDKLLNDHPHMRLPFLEQNQYTILTFAYYLGSFVSLSSIQSLTLMRPWLPTVFQLLNFILWSANLQYELVTNFNLIFVWTMWVGVHSGTSYTNFLFLATTKTNLDCDMNLNYYERELVVNLLLISNDLGLFFAQAVATFIMLYKYPELLFNPPG